MKDISFAYPSSPNAAMNGFSRSGCWIVNLHGEMHKAFAISDKHGAIAYANTLSDEWSPYSLVRPDGSFFSAKSAQSLLTEQARNS